MRIEVTCCSVSGNINAPASKSAMQRFVAGALLAEGISRLKYPSFCDDAVAAMDIARALGAEITVKEGIVEVSGGFNPVSGQIFTGESGLATRMFTPIAALHSKEITINGKGSILTRPVKMVEGPLAELGVEVTTSNGFLPVIIRGPLKGGEVFADGSISSQFITGLLMALPVVKEDSLLVVANLVSKPYIDLTLRILKEFNINIINRNYEKFEITGRQKYLPGEFSVEGDWSGAAFMLVLAAIGGNAVVNNLDMSSAQADKAILEILALAGAKVMEKENRVEVSKEGLHSFSIDISECPDLAPPVIVLALACRGKSVIKGTERLVSKESDRGKILADTLSSLGGRIVNFGDRIEVEGGNALNGGIVSAHNDHRIAMALASVSIICNSPVTIEGMECINKSYPGFLKDFIKLGGEVNEL